LSTFLSPGDTVVLHVFAILFIHTFCTLRFALPRSSSVHFKRKCSHNKLFLEELMFYEITVNSNTAVCLRHYLKTFNTFLVKAFELTNNVAAKERKSKFRLLSLKNYHTNPGCDLHHMKPNLGLSWYRPWSLQHRNRGFVSC